MSLSLVPEYASSESESDSEHEGEKGGAEKKAPTQLATVTESALAIPSASRGLGAKLASILPESKHKAATDSNKVQIVVDFGRPSSAQAGPGASEASSAPNAPTTKPSDSSAKRQAGGMFSELLSILPAPKNSRSNAPAGAKADSVGVDGDAAKPAPTPTLQSLIPHSISSKRRGRMAASTPAKGNATATAATRSDSTDNISEGESDVVDDVKDEARSPVSGSDPFFTIGTVATRAEEPNESASVSAVDLPADSITTNQTQAQSTASELVYDPNSGYYYSYTSERYYYYDAENGEYVDAQALYSEEQEEREEQEAPATVSRIDPSDLKKLIGRGALKRGEIQEMATAVIKDVSLAGQLHNSGYSDTRMATEFSAQRSAEQQQQASKHIVVGDEADRRKKKSKNNIMYLALQAQEQGAKLKDAHANRQRAKKEARAKYGY
ncbi:hypothetical protein IWW37_002667 [Coemansia sp. RSA 2050]|nr:hypothetical protein IWW37_002667 [Coemansia sp. RSA 2050]